MSTADIVRAWKRPQFRAGLTAGELALLPAHPAGLVELATPNPGWVTAL